MMWRCEECDFVLDFGDFVDFVDLSIVAGPTAINNNKTRWIASDFNGL